MRSIFRSLLVLLMLPSLFLGGKTAQAAGPILDAGKVIDLTNIYDDPQVIPDVFSSTGVFGKLVDTADIYKFVPDKDGEQQISLLGTGAGADAQPYLVLIDPTTATESRSLGIPLPDDTYHTGVITAVEGLQTVNEPLAFTQYTLYAQQRIALKKDIVYYLVIFDPSRTFNHYAIRFGDSNIWTIGQVAKHFGSWLKFRTEAYAGSSPFKFTPGSFGALLFFLALAVLVGMWVIEESFSFLSNRSKMAGYILIKLQKFSRYFTWIGLWFMALGGYVYFDHIGWSGVPFVLTLIFIPMVVLFLVRTLVISPKLMALEVNKQEAVIPLPLRRTMYIMFVLSVIVIGSFMTFLAIHLS